MGYDASESYGLTWKVRGLCTKKLENVSLFKTRNVYGDIKDCDIYGAYIRSTVSLCVYLVHCTQWSLPTRACAFSCYSLYKTFIDASSFVARSMHSV